MTRYSSASADCWLGHGTEHERDDARIERLCLAGEMVSVTILDVDRDRRIRGGLLRTLAQVALGLHGDDLTD
jgi:hypothetical protein